MPSSCGFCLERWLDHPDVGRAEYAVLRCLFAYLGSRGCFPRQSVVAAKLKTTREAVCRAIAKLKRIGALVVKRTGRANRYTFADLDAASAADVTPSSHQEQSSDHIRCDEVVTSDVAPASHSQNFKHQLPHDSLSDSRGNPGGDEANADQERELVENHPAEGNSDVEREADAEVDAGANKSAADSHADLGGNPSSRDPSHGEVVEIIPPGTTHNCDSLQPWTADGGQPAVPVYAVGHGLDGRDWDEFT